MGHTSSDDMNSQIRLTFETKEEAIGYAKRNGIAYQVFKPKTRTRATISYSDNFRRPGSLWWSNCLSPPIGSHGPI